MTFSDITRRRLWNQGITQTPFPYPFAPLTAAEENAFHAAAQRYREFFRRL